MSDLWPLFVGRFQPFHRGHLAMARAILREHEGVRFGVGSAQYSDSPKNPFSFEERVEMISKTMDAEGMDNYDVVAIMDFHDDKKWINHVLEMLPNLSVVYANDEHTIGLFRDKGVDVRVLPLKERHELSGTEVRRRMLKNGNWKELVPNAVRDILSRIDGPERIRRSARESDTDED